ncbi:MAG TPA: helix-turn-helix domain-containing protein [Candidatus Hydrogenedens sp.]|nr:helix-turn-helix domain-containing protein [Candidatus Hydrogenedens sp.]
MARIKLHIQQSISELTLKTILETKGHIISDETFNILITDDYPYALNYARTLPTLVLATAQQIPKAVELMKEGVFGYIFVPFQPDEASMMIERALGLWKIGETHYKNTSVSLAELESEVILKTLAECHFNHSKAAQRLGIARNTLWRKLKRIKPQKNKKNSH